MGWARKAAGGAQAEETPAPVLRAVAHTWSPQQAAIYDWFEHGAGNLIVRARAGTGKTTTILHGVGLAPEGRGLLAAFNKRIAVELQARLITAGTTGIDAQTLHSLGFMLVRENWKVRVEQKSGTRAETLARQVCGSKAHAGIVRLVGMIHTKARELTPLARTVGDLSGVAEQFNADPADYLKMQGFDLDYVLEHVLLAMRLAARDATAGTIDFADMIFLPIVNDWVRPMYPLVVVDEAQDMNAPQLLLARGVLEPGGRMCVVGDDRQGIYGFRGADSTALDRLKKELDAQELGLTTTYRCGQQIVALAKTLVPDFEAGAGNPEGVVSALSYNELFTHVKGGDFVLSRKNAPLVSVAMKLLRDGVRAEIAGRDIGQGLMAIVRQSKATTIDALDRWLTSWEANEVSKALRRGWRNRAALVQDQAETLSHLTARAETVQDVIDRIEFLFTDDIGGEGKVTCSSVHKAKGLERDRVFTLDWTFSYDELEEQNIAYVAWTRAKSLLVRVQDKAMAA